MGRTTTNIVQSRSNLTALLTATGVLKACFGKNVEFTNSATTQEDNRSLKYQVVIWGKIPMERVGIGVKANFRSFVEFTLKEPDPKKEIDSNLRPDGPVKVRIIGWNQAIDVWHLGNNDYFDDYCVANGSEKSLFNFKEKLFELCKYKEVRERALRRLEGR
ncbi:MAG: hypothetical protein WCW29_02050 [Candidatus Paceibacterota bacterium]